MGKSNIFIFLLTGFMLMSLASAIQISPSQVNLNIPFTETATFKLNLTNTHNYTLYNLTFQTDKLTQFNIGTIVPGQSREITFTTKSMPIGNYNNNITILTFTKVGCSSLQHTIHKISLFSNQFQPSQLCLGDSIEFKNTYNFPVNLKIYKMSGQEFITQDIAVNGTYTTPAFSVIENYYFTGNFNSLFQGDIIVSSIESLVHDAQNDGSFSLQMNVIPKNTSLSITTSIDTYTINYNESRTGFISISNNGTFEALNIILSGEWFIFTENNFNLQPGDVKAVNYRIQPLITSEVDTNKLYTKIVTLRSLNAGNTQKSFNINVPYANIGNNENTTAQFWLEKKRFCDAYPTSQFCITEPIIEIRNVTIYEGPPVNANISQKAFQELIEDILNQKAERDTLTNNIKLTNDKIDTAIIDINNNVDEIKTNNSQYQANISKNIENISITTIIAVFLIFFSIFGSIAGYFAYTQYKNRNKLKIGVKQI